MNDALAVDILNTRHQLPSKLTDCLCTWCVFQVPTYGSQIPILCVFIQEVQTLFVFVCAMSGGVSGSIVRGLLQRSAVEMKIYIFFKHNNTSRVEESAIQK